MTTTDIPPTRQPADIFELAGLASLCEWWGWSPADSFLMAMQMAASGIGAGQAAKLFRDAGERVQ